jgi:hypothetical protein
VSINAAAAFVTAISIDSKSLLIQPYLCYY